MELPKWAIKIEIQLYLSVQNELQPCKGLAKEAGSKTRGRDRKFHGNKARQVGAVPQSIFIWAEGETCSLAQPECAVMDTAM